jgi:hypothetical protein
MIAIILFECGHHFYQTGSPYGEVLGASIGQTAVNTNNCNYLCNKSDAVFHFTDLKSAISSASTLQLQGVTGDCRVMGGELVNGNVQFIGSRSFGVSFLQGLTNQEVSGIMKLF